MSEIELNGRTLGDRRPTFVVAEAGINHNGSEETAHAMIEAAAACGADAIKFQSFRAEHLTSPDASAPIHVRGFTRQTLFEFFRSMELNEAAHRRLKEHADATGLVFLSTPFDEEMADLLEDLDVPAFKIASGDLTHAPLLRHVARKGRPIFLSTGMADLDEVRAAVALLQRSGAPALALLHCVSAYPAEPRDLNLRAIATLREAFGFPVGFSDHSVDSVFALAAIASGACILERHFTLDREMPGPDQGLSMDPRELKRTVEQIRVLESALGDGVKKAASGEMENRRLSRRSVVVRETLSAGQELSEGLLDARRPGSGIPPTEIYKLMGKRLVHPLPAGTPVEWSDLV